MSRLPARLVDQRTFDDALVRLHRELNRDLEEERRKRRKVEDDVAALRAKVIKLEERASTPAAQEAGHQRQDDRQASSGHQEANQERLPTFPTGAYHVNGTKLDDMPAQAVISIYNACYEKITAAGKEHAMIQPIHLRDDFMTNVADPWNRVPRKPGTQKTPRWSAFKAYCTRRSSQAGLPPAV